MDSSFQDIVPGAIWTAEYPVHYFGMDMSARMTAVRLPQGDLVLHSPGPMTPVVRAFLDAKGPVRHIIAPGTFHYLHIPEAQAAYPLAKTYVCPGVEKKLENATFDWLLSDRAPDPWLGIMEQVLIRGSRWMWEVAFFHKPSRTLILTDLIEMFTDHTPHVDWKLKAWWKLVFRMWNKPRPAPEYQLGWYDKDAARAALDKVLAWDFERIILSHGDLIETDAKAFATEAFSRILHGPPHDAVAAEHG